MSEERLNEIKDSIELQMQVQQAVGYKNRYDDLLIEEIDLYNEVINLQQENKQLKEIEKEHQKINGELREELQKANDTLDTHNELINHLQEVIEEVRDVIEKMIDVGYVDGMTCYYPTKNDSEFGVRAKILLQILDKGESNE